MFVLRKLFFFLFFLLILCVCVCKIELLVILASFRKLIFIIV